MARTVAIGIQDFEKIREENVFYIDKTDFIREWWENGDEVTFSRDFPSGRTRSTGSCRGRIR